MIGDLRGNPSKPTDLWGEPTAQSGIGPKFVSGPWSRIQPSLHCDFNSPATPPAWCSPQCSLSTQTSHVGLPRGSIPVFASPDFSLALLPELCCVSGAGWLWTWAGQGAEHTMWPMTRGAVGQVHRWHFHLLEFPVQESSLEAGN